LLILGLLAALGRAAVGASAATAEEGPQDENQDEYDCKDAHENGKRSYTVGQDGDSA